MRQTAGSSVDYAVQEFLKESKQTKEAFWTQREWGSSALFPKLTETADYGFERTSKLEQKVAVLESRVSFLETSLRHNTPQVSGRDTSGDFEEKMKFMRLLTKAESLIHNLTLENQKLRAQLEMKDEDSDKKISSSIQTTSFPPPSPEQEIRPRPANPKQRVTWNQSEFRRTVSAQPRIPHSQILQHHPPPPNAVKFKDPVEESEQPHLLPLYESPETKAKSISQPRIKPVLKQRQESPEPDPINNKKVPTRMKVQYPAGYDPQKRRYSVSSESFNPEQFRDVKLKVIPKSEEVKQRIRNTVRGNVLFKHLDDDQLDEVVDSMDEVEFEANSIVIKQGSFVDENHMYLINEGEVTVLYGDEPVASLGSGGAFGEIALMYGCPRTATILTGTPCKLWTLDRNTFRRILMEESIRRRKLYESVLAKVPIFKSLLPYERSKVADALESVIFKDGEIILTQGSTDTDKFYIIEKGEVVCTKSGKDGSSPVEALRLKAGDYFGELALLRNEPRQATVTAVGTVKCLTIGREHFNQVMGPCEDILQRNIGSYKSYDELLTSLKRNESPQLVSHDFDLHEELPSTRDDVVRYIVQSENEYVFNLTQAEGYYKAISEHSEYLNITKEQFEAIFSNLNDILNIQRQFAKSLSDSDNQEIGKNYLNFAPSLTAYETFVKDYPTSRKTLDECSKSTKFSDFLMACHKEAGESLDTLLIQVCTRLFRILYLLRHLEEVTETSHPDKNNLALAIRKLDSINSTLDEVKVLQ